MRFNSAIVHVAPSFCQSASRTAFRIALAVTCFPPCALIVNSAQTFRAGLPITLFAGGFVHARSPIKCAHIKAPRSFTTRQMPTGTPAVSSIRRARSRAGERAPVTSWLAYDCLIPAFLRRMSVRTFRPSASVLMAQPCLRLLSVSRRNKLQKRIDWRYRRCSLGSQTERRHDQETHRP